MRLTHHVVAGIRALVRESGPASASEALVFVHGNPGSSEHWVDLMQHAGDFARCIAPDLPAFGGSERPKTFDYSVEGYANYLGALLAQLGVRRAHLVLHDFGGPFGLAWASVHSERVGSIVLFDIGIAPDYRWHYLARIWRTPLLGEFAQAITTRGRFRRFLNRANPKALPDAFIERMFEDRDPAHASAVLALYRATHDLGALSARLAAVLTPLRLPALVVWGEADAYVPARYAALQTQYFAAQVHVIPNAGHWPMIDEPDEVRRLFLTFTRNCLEPRGEHHGLETSQ
jgi:pimeloyl-ACP methyl ester carboxylesterase